MNLLLSGAETSKPPPLRLAFRNASSQEVGTVSSPTVAADFSGLEPPWACVSWKWAVRLPRRREQEQRRDWSAVEGGGLGETSARQR
ncbi:MAG: hypothetical protein JXB05_32595 [Myxococcaceae bacterium]|nr:hypothetical protein [Myxococcaceae bacterium]